MKKYLQAIYQSFGSPALYTQVIHQWMGTGLMYLMVLATVMTLIISSVFVKEIIHFNRDVLPPLLTQIPEITITNGVASTTDKTPRIIRDNHQKPVVIIDTSKEDTYVPTEDNIVFVGKTFIDMQKGKGDSRRIKLSDFGTKTFVLNTDTVKTFFRMIPFIFVLFLPFIIFMQWAMLLVMAALAACLSYVVTAYMPEEYNFETRMRMAVIAITPPLLANKILQAFTPYHLGFWIILAVWILHLYLMVVGSRYYLKKHPVDAV